MLRSGERLCLGGARCPRRLPRLPALAHAPAPEDGTMTWPRLASTPGVSRGLSASSSTCAASELDTPTAIIGPRGSPTNPAPTRRTKQAKTLKNATKADNYCLSARLCDSKRSTNAVRSMLLGLLLLHLFLLLPQGFPPI